MDEILGIEAIDFGLGVRMFLHLKLQFRSCSSTLRSDILSMDGYTRFIRVEVLVQIILIASMKV